MNNESEINEDDKMAKYTIFSCLSAYIRKSKRESKELNLRNEILFMITKINKISENKPIWRTEDQYSENNRIK